MAAMPPIVLPFRADPDHAIRFARTVEKHFGALADDLEMLRDSDGAEKRKAVHEPVRPDGSVIEPHARCTNCRRVAGMPSAPCPQCPPHPAGCGACGGEAEFPASTAGVPFLPTSEIAGQSAEWAEACPHCPRAFAGKNKEEALLFLAAHCNAEHLDVIKTAIAEQT
jgi:hypothetical protein